MKKDLSLIKTTINIPIVYPNNLEECLRILETLRYECYGFPIVFLSYDYSISKAWEVTFRNPSNFSNPDIKDKSPLKACHKMFDFLKTLK